MNTCFNCDRSEQDVPLLALNFQGRTLRICPQCLPALIHKPHAVAAKLPGMNAIGVDEPET
jgi:hypothetical protein